MHNYSTIFSFKLRRQVANLSVNQTDIQFRTSYFQKEKAKNILWAPRLQVCIATSLMRNILQQVSVLLICHYFKVRFTKRSLNKKSLFKKIVNPTNNRENNLSSQKLCVINTYILRQIHYEVARHKRVPEIYTPHSLLFLYTHAGGSVDS